jgi:hypothetical protein
VPFTAQPTQLVFIQFLEQEQSPNLVDITGKDIAHRITSFRDTGERA